MTQDSFTFTFEQDEKSTIAAIKVRAKAATPKVKGHLWVTLLRVLQCTMLGLGALGVGVALEYLVSGRIGLPLWSVAIGVGLLYAVVFGGIFITVPVMARRALAIRANQGPVTLTLDATGLSTQTGSFQSHIKWAAIQAVTRGKLGFVSVVGASRPTLPFHAFKDPSKIDTVEVAIKKWMEASR